MNELDKLLKILDEKLVIEEGIRADLKGMIEDRDHYKRLYESLRLSEAVLEAELRAKEERPAPNVQTNSLVIQWAKAIPMDYVFAAHNVALSNVSCQATLYSCVSGARKS